MVWLFIGIMVLTRGGEMDLIYLPCHPIPIDNTITRVIIIRDSRRKRQTDAERLESLNTYIDIGNM